MTSASTDLPSSAGAESISVVIPVYNSEESLPRLIPELLAALEALTREFEIILVDDGSRDRSAAAVRELAAKHAEVRGIELMRNYGQHNALLAGIRVARNAVLVTMDDDLQHPPSELPKLLAKLAEGADVVYGVPEHQQHGLARDLASQITKLVLKGAMGAATASRISAFRAFRKEVTAAFSGHRGSYVNVDVLLTWGTTRFASVVVRHDERRFGTSNYTFRKLVVHAMNMITGFSVLPLQVASFVGFAALGFGLLVLAFVLGRYLLEGTSVPGFPFLASLVSILAGAQLFAIGVIGEYLARIHFRLLDKPLYTVRSDSGEP
ncbi:MAG TPA: glycosyltransferase family 2 protein [Polyangiaceae bacterium]|nr:glycosyltransferase family 2 protein [Polyangiaceae bacterium]